MPPESPPPDAENKRIAAGICGILLGFLGVHKFVLGYTNEGLIMLLVSLVGGVITCGLATSVICIIGLAEGIIYLTKTNEQFAEMYIYNQHPWF
jgi:TM2 domain-containing membrane protein YozV